MLLRSAAIIIPLQQNLHASRLTLQKEITKPAPPFSAEHAAIFYRPSQTEVLSKVHGKVYIPIATNICWIRPNSPPLKSY